MSNSYAAQNARFEARKYNEANRARLEMLRREARIMARPLNVAK